MVMVEPLHPGANSIGAMVPDGWRTRSDAARAVGRSPDRLKDWHRRALAGQAKYAPLAPSGKMRAGLLEVHLYSDADVQRLVEFVSGDSPPPQHEPATQREGLRALIADYDAAVEAWADAEDGAPSKKAALRCVRAASRLAEHAQTLLKSEVQWARAEEAASWSDVGRALETSRQNAQQRFS